MPRPLWPPVPYHVAQWIENWMGLRWEQKNLLFLPELQAPDRPNRSTVTAVTAVLLNQGNNKKKLTQIKIRLFWLHIAKQFLRFQLMARQIMKNIPVAYELSRSLPYSQEFQILSVSRKTNPAHILPTTSFRSIVPKGTCVKTASLFSVVTRLNTLRLLSQLI